MYIPYLSSELTESKDVVIFKKSKNPRANINISEKHCIGQWESKGHKISLYTQYNKLFAIVQDLSEKIITLFSENILGGINGKIPQSTLFKMIKCDQSRIALTLHQNRNNHLTLWIMPKLEAAGRADEILIKKAKKYEEQAQEYANLFIELRNADNFNEACSKYQKALNLYKKAYNVRNKHAENTEEIESFLSELKKKIFLFKIDQKMVFYLPERADQDEVKAIFDLFIDKEDVFATTLDEIKSIPEEERSKDENFACAYSAEFLKHYALAIKSYLLLSKQNYENENQDQTSYSGNCLKKAESLVEEAKQAPDYFNIEDFLKEVKAEWITKTIGNIPGNDYFKNILEENQLKKLAYEFVKKAREESNKYTTYIQNEEIFKNVCKAYEDAIYLQIAYDFIKKNESNIQEAETDINELKKELFEFKLPHVMSLYLPSVEDQNSFFKNLSLLENEENFSSLMFKLTGNLPERHSLVDNFTCAYVYEFLNKPTRAAQHYLYLSQQYVDNSNPSLSVKCLKKAETLIEEKAKASDIFAMANFLAKLDRSLLEQLLNNLPNSDPNIEYLEKTLLKKDAIRITFKEHLHSLGKLSPKINKSTCFICFNVEEDDVVKWLESTLVPDLDEMGIKPMFCLSNLGQGKELSAFQGLIRQSDLVIVICTPLLKKKCDVQNKNPTRVAQEIRLLMERYNDTAKYKTIYPIYFKGNRQSSCPSVFLKPIIGAEFSILDKSTEFSVFTYYSNAFELFGGMCGIARKKIREVKEQFLSKTKNIISDNQVDNDKVAAWRKKRIDKNKILLKSISDNIFTQTKVVNFPLHPQDFTGRKTELNDLHEACKNNNTVFITGFGGIGKTSLALKYADKYKSHYKFIYFIIASSQDSIVQGLVDLADKMNIPSGDIPIRLKNLRNQLDEFKGDYLLIFDGIDNPEDFEELKKHLPNNRKCILLTSRMSELATQELRCKSLPLNAWPIEEAVDYLLKTTKKEEADQVKILAEKLGCLPLALVHASAYIRTRNYTICKYIEQFEQYEIKLFEKEHLELENEEKTILNTLQITLNEIENYHKCFIAKPILAFLSFFSQAPIPLIVIEHWFKTFFCNHSELELGDGLSYLYNYSMIENPSPDCYAVHLSVQNVIRCHLSSDEHHNNLIQALNTFTYYMQDYDFEDSDTSSFIRIIVPHCEILINYLKKSNDSRLDIEDAFTIFEKLGLYFLQEGFSKKSLVCLKCCQKIAKKLYGTKHANMGRLMHNIGIVLQDQGKSDDAEAHYREALEIKTKAYGTRDHLEVSKTIGQIGTVLQDQGNLGEAEAHYREALEIKTKVYGTRDHFKVAATIQNIGMVLQVKGKFDEAEVHYIEALEILTKAYGTRDHPEVAKTIHNIGRVLQDLGKFDEAKTHYMEALEILTKAYGTRNHPEVAVIIHSMGIVLQDQGKLDESEDHYRETLEILTKAYGTIDCPEVAATIHNIGTVLQGQGKLDEAEAHYREALEIKNKAYGTRNHPEVAATIHNIGIVLQRQGKFDEAEAHYKESLEILTKAYGTRDHPEVAATIHNIGRVLQRQGKFDEAEAHHREALEIKTKAYGTRDHPEVAKTIHSIGVVLQDQGKLDEALAHYREVLEIETKAYGTRDHPEVAKTIHNIGVVLQDQGKLDEAEAHYIDALEIETKVYGTRNHPEVAKTIHSIENVQQEKGDERPSQCLLS